MNDTMNDGLTAGLNQDPLLPPPRARSARPAPYSPGLHGEAAPLFAALVKAKAAFEVAGKTEENPHFRRNYAPLSEVQAATDPALHANGLALLQPIDDSSGEPVLYSVLIHESGSYWCAAIRIGDVRGVQELGSKISYLRRYMRLSFFGVSVDDEEDDDGNAADGKGPPPAGRQASGRSEPRPPARQEQRPPAPRQAAAPGPAPAPTTLSAPASGTIDTTAEPAPSGVANDQRPASTPPPAEPSGACSNPTKMRVSAALIQLHGGKDKVSQQIISDSCKAATGKGPKEITEADGLCWLAHIQAEIQAEITKKG